eukprot:g4426.t1
MFQGGAPRRKRTKRYVSEFISPALNVLKHNDLPFVLAEYLDPRSRINARTALRDKKAWIPKQVLQYVKEKTERGEHLTWGWSSLKKVVKEDKFELLRWADTFSNYVNKKLCEVAARFGKLDKLKWVPSLILACRNGNLETVKLFLKNNDINVNEADEVGKTALHWASMGGHNEVAKAILSNPKFTNVNQADDHGRTALHLASREVMWDFTNEVAKAILSHSKFTNVNQADNDGQTA